MQPWQRLRFFFCEQIIFCRPSPRRSEKQLAWMKPRVFADQKNVHAPSVHCKLYYKTTQYLSVGLVRFSFDDGLWVARVTLMLKMMLKTIRGRLLPVKMWYKNNLLHTFFKIRPWLWPKFVSVLEPELELPPMCDLEVSFSMFSNPSYLCTTS